MKAVNIGFIGTVGDVVGEFWPSPRISNCAYFVRIEDEREYPLYIELNFDSGISIPFEDSNRNIKRTILNSIDGVLYFG